MSTVRTMQFKKEQQQKLFNPLDPNGFEHVYYSKDGRWVPE